MSAILLPLVAAALRIASVTTLVSAAVSDIKRRIIPNRTSLTALGVGAVLRLVAEPHMFVASVLAASAVYLGLAGLAYLKLLGGGDVKLAAAASFFVPAGEVPALLLDIALAGGILCIVVLVVGRISTIGRKLVPYGVAISAA